MFFQSIPNILIRVDEISQVRDPIKFFGHAFCHRATASRPVLKAELNFDGISDIERSTFTQLERLKTGKLKPEHINTRFPAKYYLK